MAISEQHKQLRARVETAAQNVPTLELSFREMFGGVMIYSSGKPFASLSEPGLAVKLNESDRKALLQEPGAEPLRHDGEAPSKQYVVVPAHILEDSEQLGVWLERSAVFVASLPSKKKK
jgi:TfoX/Sxy family transcriptional regulator of competence genes